MQRISLAVFVCFGLLVFLVAPRPAGATLTFEYTWEFSGGTSPVGSTPWLTATFEDGVHDGVNGAYLTLETTHLTPKEFVSEWDFNLKDTLSTTSLSFIQTASTGTFTSPAIRLGSEAYKADGGGYYDISLQFSTAGNNGSTYRFGEGDSVTFFISGITGLTESDFLDLASASGAHGPFYTAAHVQGIGSAASLSGWVTVPEPGTLLLLGVGLTGLYGYRAKRRARK